MATCGATARSTGQPCTKLVANGNLRCRHHGGASPQAKAAARRRHTETQARAVLGRLDVQPVDNPLTELQWMAGRVRSWMELMEQHVARLTATRYRAGSSENIRGEVQLLERAMDRFVTVLAAIARLNIDERLAQITEEQVETAADALTATLRELGLDAEQQRQASLSMARRLRAV